MHKGKHQPRLSVHQGVSKRGSCVSGSLSSSSIYLTIWSKGTSGKADQTSANYFPPCVILGRARYPNNRCHCSPNSRTPHALSLGDLRLRRRSRWDSLRDAERIRREVVLSEQVPHRILRWFRSRPLPAISAPRDVARRWPIGTNVQTTYSTKVLLYVRLRSNGGRGRESHDCDLFTHRPPELDRANGQEPGRPARLLRFPDCSFMNQVLDSCGI